MTALLTDNLPMLTRAPNGIKKLRELILELAVRGKLVPQDLSDEPASELLKRIAQEKARLVAEGKIKKPKSTTDVETLEKLYDLPAGWEWTTLPGAANYKIGKTPPTKEARYWNDSGLPWVSISDMEHYGEITKTSRKVSEIASKDIFKYQPVPAGTLLMSFKLTVGKVSILGINAYHNEAIVSLSPYSGVSKEYLFKFLPSIALGGQQKNALMGSTLNSESMAQLLVPLPPVAEQHRIVAKVDELMALCDRLEAQQADAESAHAQLVQALLDSLTQATDAADFASSWQRLTEHFHTLFTTETSIDALRQTLLQLAVMGKLVPHSQQHTLSAHQPENERYKHPGLEFQVPMHWCIKKLEQVSQSIVDCPHSTPRWAETGVVCVRTSQFKAGCLDLSSSKYVSEETYLERTQRLEPRADDILYSREGGILGIACRIPQGTRLCLGQRMMLIRPTSEVLPEFVEMTLNSPLITSIARNKTTGGAAPRVNVSVVKAYPVPLPPLPEQHRIIAKINQLLALCDQLKTRLTQAREVNQQLASALVEQATA